MVRLRGMPRLGPPGRGMGRPRPMLRHVRPEPILPPFGMPRGRLIRGHPVRPGAPRLPPPRMGPPPPPGLGLGLPPPLPPRRLPMPPHHPLSPRDLPVPPPMVRRPLPPPMARRPGMPPPPIPPMPPHLRRPIRPGPQFIRGRGGNVRRGVKRLGATSNGRAKKTQKRKEKTEGEFFCESCDRGFKTQDLLDAHIAEHKVCGRDGCVFAAHPKIVEKHVQLQHETGLYQRIVFTQTPEEVAKWIAERRSRYPTKENVEKKDAQTSEMIQRGERIPMQGRQFHNKNKLGGWQDRKRNQCQNNTNRNDHKKQRTKPINHITDEENKWRDSDAWRGNLPKFPGSAAFPLLKDEPLVENEEDMHVSDDEFNIGLDTETENVNGSAATFSSVLASLIMNYGSDSDEEDENTISQVPGPSGSNLGSITHKVEQGESTKEKVICAQNGDSQPIKNENDEDLDSGPEESSIRREESTDQPVPNLAKENNDHQKNRHTKSKTTEVSRPLGPKHGIRPPLKKYQLSLLEKLLQNEIRHERNAILQCVRYVVTNNFLGCGNSK